jgi:predicted dinucleotide-binding enzyme
MATRVGVLGSGQVAQVLAKGFQKHGYEVMIGSREPSKLSSWQAESGQGIALGDFAAAASFGEIVVLAVLGRAAGSAVQLAGIDNLAGKVVIDATNPIDDKPPVNGILQYFTGPNSSLMEQLQAQAPDAHFVKAFSSVGNHFMVNPQIPGGRPTMFICGNSDDAKKTVVHVLDQFGWDAEDIGKVEGARAIEPLCQLWCAPGFLRNQWTHAFKVIKL